MSFICFNGQFLSASTPIFQAGNRSFKWGDGVFETIHVHKKKILLETLHFERLFLSLQILQLPHNQYNQQLLKEYILELSIMNECAENARVRVSIYRDDEKGSSFVMEATPLAPREFQWNEKGLSIDLYPHARKTMDAIANLKTNNYLTYILAGLFARQIQVDDAIVLNGVNRLCDSSKANIFLVKDNEIFTPSLSEGCINGVMRQFLMEQLNILGYRIYQTSLTEKDLSEADEVFLTNAIIKIHWVHHFRNKIYSSSDTFNIFRKIFSTIQG